MTQRILFYLILALVCYGIAFTSTYRVAIAVFLVAGIVGELLLWREVFTAAWGRRDSSQENPST